MFLDSLFKAKHNHSLFADDINKLQIDITSLDKDILRLNVYLSSISFFEKQYPIHSLSEKLSLFSFPVLLSSKATLLKYIGISDLLNTRVKPARQELEAALFSYQLIRDDEQAAEIATLISRLAFLQEEKNIAFLNNNIAIAAYEHLGMERNLLGALFWRAELLFDDGRYNAAEELLMKRALMKSFRLSDRKAEMNVYYQLGKIYLAMKKNTEALWFLLQARDLAIKMRRKEDELKCLLMIAKLKVYENNLALALADLKLAEKIVSQNPQYQAYDVDLSNQLVKLYHLLGPRNEYQVYTLRFSQLKKDYLSN